ncbi:LPXTG cell wall anchor domain-containing protein [Streptomyces sp. NPDC101227]|uniref:LPXTG cell wall anchor domain-containing protein n=1 Tax=Streptomyces sp. NPDC101227 TaxID=3366136 RepID=UPI003823ACEA
MTQHIRSGRRRWWAAAAMALACAISLTGLPGAGQAEAKPKQTLKQGKRCDEEYKDYYDFSNVPVGGMPADGFVRPAADRDEYDYVNGQKQWDGLRAPTAKELADLSDTPSDYKKGDHQRVWAYYKKAQDTKRWKGVPFETYRDDFYIPKGGNDPRGKAYMAKLVYDYGLVGPDWICEKEFEIFDPETKERYVRRADAYHKPTGEIVEGKSGDEPDGKQRPKDKAMLKDPNHADKKITYAYGRDPKGSATKHINELKEIAPGRVKQITYHADAVEKAPAKAANGPDRRVDPYMNPKPGAKTGSRGAGNDMIQKSPETPKELADRLARMKKDPAASQMPKGPGGIDFSTLEIQYVGQPVKGKGLNYSFSAKDRGEDERFGWGGKAKAQMASDAFFTWLALTPDKFWVNLNPDQPDRVMDTKFASTDAGRVLLEADLQMKHDFFKTMDPKTDLGRRFWAALPQVDGRPCFTGIRNWIEPKPAKVREQDGGIYILDAPLGLKSVEQDTTTQPGGGEGICHPTKAQRDQAQRVINRMIVPAVEKTINTAGQYADLRRVYNSRVAAEYIRRQDTAKPTDYHNIINSNNVKAWPLRAPNKNWDKDVLFRKYRNIFINGEFKYNVNTAQGVQVMIVGGVDFSKAPKRNITRLRFRAQNRYLPRQTDTSVRAVTDDIERDGLLLLGGNSNGKNDGGTDTPNPQPTPSGTGKPDPTDPPSTPDPDPTTPGPGDTGKPTPPAKDPSGDLAETGSETPIGLISGIAAALAAAGGALVWWMRRRNSVQE